MDRTTCKQCDRPLDMIACPHLMCSALRHEGFCTRSCKEWYYELKDVLLHKVNYQ